MVPSSHFMLYRLVPLFIVLSIATGISIAQYPARHQVNVDNRGNNIRLDAANEPTICVDPHNPNRMAIAWREFPTVESGFRILGLAISRDGGRRWRRVPQIEPSVFRSDPVLAVDSEGNFLLYSLSSDSLDDYTCDVFISHNQGITWTSRISAGGGDKPWMVVDRTLGPGHGNIYVAWSYIAGCCYPRSFTRSIDGGRTFLNPVLISNDALWPMIGVGVGGEVHIVFAEDSNYQAYYTRSPNAHDRTQTPIVETPRLLELGGRTPHNNAPNPGGLPGQFSLVVDHSSGPYRGNVYALMSVDPPGDDPLDVMMARSTDGGDSWEPPVRVNDDPAAAGHWNWFGTMSIAPNGRLDAIWNDTRDDPNGRRCQTHYSSSSDGGESWSASVPITPYWLSNIGWPRDQTKIGDYYHILSDNVGADLAFAATLNVEQDVYYMRIGQYDCNGNGVGDITDILSGTAADVNHNDIPDECESTGNVNCAQGVGNDDIDAFILALVDPNAYSIVYPHCNIQNADVNLDGAVDNGDIDAFVALMLGG